MDKIQLGEIKSHHPAKQAKYRELKMKLANVLCCSPYCTLCLAINNLSNINEVIVVQNLESNYFFTMKMVLEKLFHEKVMSSDFICDGCKESSLKNFIFIFDTEKSLNMIAEYISQINQQIDQMNSTMENSNGEMEFSNIVFLFKDPSESNVELEMQYNKNERALTDKSQNSDDSDTENSEGIPSEDEVKNLLKRYKCNICDKKLKSRQGILYHMKTSHDNKKFYCPECCDYECPHRKYLEPMQNIKRKSCLDCDYVCWTRSSLITHVNNKHLFLQPYICEHCAKPLDSQLAYMKHQKMFHTSYFSCQYCDSDFTKMVELDAHTAECKQFIRAFKCEKCVASFDSDSKLKKHSKKHASVIPCDGCDKVFTTESMLSRHKVIHQQIKTIKSAIYTCSICHTVFQTKKELNVHMTEHDKTEKHVCNYCNLQFDSAKEYRVHVTGPAHISIAGCSKLYCCEECNYTARAKFVLEAHINRYHLKQKPYKCSECDKAFTTEFNLKSHLKVHSKVNITKKRYVCEICQKVLCGPTALKKHVRTHTGERPYACEICGERFLSSSILKMHQRSKHEEKSIPCPLCPLMFHSLSYMRTHFKKIHWTLNEEFDIMKVEGLTEEQYDMFRDRRQLVIE